MIEHSTEHFYKNRKMTENISIETMSEEFKPIALEKEKYEIENRQNRKTNWNFPHDRFIIITTYMTKKGLFHLKNILKTSSAIQALIEEIKKVVFVKDESEYWNIWILIAILPLLRNQDCTLNITDKILIFRKRIACLK